MSPVGEMLQKARIKKYVHFFAGQYTLDPALVASVIWQESKGDPWAHRYENKFFLRYLASVASRKDLRGYVPPSGGQISLSTEVRDRSYSWGVMQVMGETAREFNYQEESLAKLLRIPENIEIGCKILDAKIKKANGNIEEGLLFWNGQANPDYGKEVLSHLASREYEKIWT